MMQYSVILTPPTKHLCLEDSGMWCLTVLENGQPAAKGTFANPC